MPFSRSILAHFGLQACGVGAKLGTFFKAETSLGEVKAGELAVILTGRSVERAGSVFRRLEYT